MIAIIDRVDRSIVNFLNGLVKKSPILNKAAEILASWPVYFIPLAMIIYWFWAPRWRLAEIRAVVAGLIAWQVLNRILQMIFERTRPIANSGISDLLFKRPGDSFPSNHAAFGMAVFLTLFLAGERSLAYFVLFLTIIFSFFRVVTGLHFPSDIIAGWLIGLGTAFGISYIASYVDSYIGQPLIKLAKLLRLA